MEIIVNLYNLHFLSFYFSSQIFSTLLTKHLERKLKSHLFSHFFIPSLFSIPSLFHLPTKQTINESLIWIIESLFKIFKFILIVFMSYFLGSWTLLIWIWVTNLLISFYQEKCLTMLTRNEKYSRRSSWIFWGSIFGFCVDWTTCWTCQAVSIWWGITCAYTLNNVNVTFIFQRFIPKSTRAEVYVVKDFKGITNSSPYWVLWIKLGPNLPSLLVKEHREGDDESW